MRRILPVALLFTLIPWISDAAPGIRGSRHDMSKSSAATVKSSIETEVCKFCHTPHQAYSSQLAWNHAPTAIGTVSWGNDLDGAALKNTTSGTLLPTTLKSGSKRCLSCHDGSVALGEVKNASGGSAGTIGGLASIAGHTDANGKLIGSYLVGSPNMGGNHPVSIPYAGQLGYNGIDSKEVADGSVGGYYAVKATGCASASGICTAAPTGAGSDGRDGLAVNLLPNAPGGTVYGVECSSCHEPHNKTGFAYFALLDNTNASGLCRSCHNK